MLHFSFTPHRSAWALALTCGLSSAAAAPTPWADGQAATLVLGADNFTTTGGGSASASRFSGPTDICTDSATGKVFVVVNNESRVLRFSAASAITNGGAAEAVFGQPDFTSIERNSGGHSAKSLAWPITCTMDAAGRLFVVDAGNRRVLRYDNAATKASFAAADGVLGQPDFTTSLTGTTASQLGGGDLYGIALSPGGALYVSDGPNKRVLRFDNAASKANGANADGVLGATDFTTAGADGTTATTLGTVYGLAMDAAGNLYASDSSNRRILRFDNAATKANGAAADGVLGAADFTTLGDSAASAASMGRSVYGIKVLTDGALYVADYTYNRVLIYNDPAHKANGAAADHVLGQSSFTTIEPGLTASGLNSPIGLGVIAQAGYLMIPEYTNNRVVGHYQASLKPNSAPTASGVAITGAAVVGQSLTGSYTYADADSDPEGTSIFVWKIGSNTITGATSNTYIPVATDVGNTLTFCVTPAASTGNTTGTQTCSAPTAAVAAVPVNGACGEAAAQATALAPAAGLCSAGTATAISSASGKYTWQCQGLNGGSANSCEAPWSAAGGSKAMVALQPANGWQVSNASFSTTPPAAAPRMTFPSGLLSLNLSSGNLGSDATVTLNFSTPVPAGAVYMKYGSSPDGFNCQGAACAQPHWYELPAGRAVLASDRLSATSTLTDGGLGDSDGIANQSIQDPGGFALLAAPTPANTAAIPTMSEWGIIALSSLLTMLGISGMRRRQF
ncbi:MAG: IPTL-CTERM sorting domain-containing protein [Comamonas sp.]|uniref:IPTL-CTERM sorting domain-containing protein n=1 Tax=Comamonas sp. TaxID=34028 RepID=UPI002825A903|nr:IPTL-CTERM sorting domain-containing protein [Comamonas sp.]MDR0215509.1 IPTL-CTERM sorting domain-containing protein [Comamonas sp.]